MPTYGSQIYREQVLNVKVFDEELNELEEI